MRLIDPNALMEKVCGNCPRNDCTPDATDTVYGCMFADSIDSMPTIEAEPVRNGRWIPCSERLPEKAGEYLVTYHPCYWDDVEWSKRCAGIDTFRGKSTWAKKKYQRVIAWMPMPSAYEPPEKE